MRNFQSKINYKINYEYLEIKRNFNRKKSNIDRNRDLFLIALYEKDLDTAKKLLEEGVVLKYDENPEISQISENNCKFACICLFLTRNNPSLQLSLIEKGLKLEPVSDFIFLEYPLTFCAANVSILERLIKVGHPLEMVFDEIPIREEKVISNIKPDPEMMEYLVKKFNCNINEKKVSDGSTFIFGKYECSEKDFKKYIDLGLDINHVDDVSRTALFGASLEKMILLINAGIDINHKDIYGQNALSYIKGKDQGIYLIDKGIETNIDGLLDNLKYIDKEKEIYNFINSYIEKNSILKKLNRENSENKIGKRL